MLPTVRLPRPFLGQNTEPFRVVVVDPTGVPFSGAQVTLQGASVPVKTDSDGVATFTFGSMAGEAVVQVQVGDYTLKARGPADQTLFVTVPIAAPGPIVTVVELAALALGTVATVYGLTKKQRATATVGEVLLGAGIFTAVYRHSCRW
jgi:hypothetical protein